MLDHIWHWRFAKKLSPALQENRLLYIAANDDDAAGGLSEQPENEHSLPEGIDASSRSIDTLVGMQREKMDKIRPLAARATINSPLAFEMALDILEEHNEDSDPEITKLINDSREYLRDKDAGEDVQTQEAFLTNAIEMLLNRTDVAFAMAEGFARRAERITELKYILGETSLTSISEVETRLALQDDVELSIDAHAISKSEVDRIIKELNINPARRSKAFDTAGMSVGIPYEDIRKGKPTHEYKVRLIQSKINAARQLAVIEQKDSGNDTTATGSAELERVFAKQALHVRKHFERTLLLRAAEQGQNYQAFEEAINAEVGSTSNAEKAAHFGISEVALTHRRLEIQDTINRGLRQAESNDGSDPENLLKAADPKFMESAKVMHMQLEELKWLDSNDFTEQKRAFIGMSIVEQKNAESWASANAVTIVKAAQRLRENKDEFENMRRLIDPEDIDELLVDFDRFAALAKRAQSGTLSANDRDILHEDLPKNKRNKFEQVLIATVSPSFMTQLRRDKADVESDVTTNSKKERTATFTALRSAEDALFENGSGSALKLKILQHDVCRALPIGDELSKLCRDIESKVRLAEFTKEPKGTELLRECRLNVAKLQESVDELQKLEASAEATAHIQHIASPEEYAKFSGTPNTVACYNRRTQTIYLNETKIAAAAQTKGKPESEIRADAIYHEQGHAIVHLLMHRIGVIPGLMLAMHNMLEQEIPGDPDKKTYSALLLERSEAWGVELNRQVIYDFELDRLQKEKRIQDPKEMIRIAKRNTDDQIQELLIDELANKYATYVDNKRDSAGFSTEDLQLFALIETQDKGLKDVRFDPDANRIRPYEEADITSQMSAEEEEALLAAAGGGSANGSDNSFGGENEGEEGPNINVNKTEDDIEKAQNRFLKMNEFIDSHEKVDGIGEFSDWTKEWEEYFNSDIKAPFYAAGSDGSREDEEDIAKKILDMNAKYFYEADKQIKAVQKMEMDETQSAQSNRGLMGLLGSIEFVSIMDMINTVKSAGEDLQRMWKRRGERAQSIFGKGLTGWIPDNNIWGAKYAGQLKHEFERRSNASEIEEVKQWKDALENVDSFALIEMLGTARDKDQLRAITELLTERGRLDWNNEKFWITLTRVSGLPMPIEACKDNSILRDQWLQRMITSIWDNDKDKFFEWRQANDSNISSGKEKFTQVADQLSNVSGGLASGLERQLKLWVENKDKGTMPEEVNPHLYEKLLHYAMSNGKMTMEEKMFYIVQGACHGLIAIDRVQALAGENGGVLNRFPVIDYFNGNHNTLPELKAISDRITESGNKFKPGQKTTIWIHLEVLRDDDAVMRMSKAMSGARTEALDHEDIPTLSAMADFKTVEELTGVLSGSRFKISYEAAKNFYTGPGTKLKILARKAQLHKDNQARFTKEDAMEAAKTIVSYIHFDNIVTGNGTDGKTRISLTHDQIATQTAPSTAGHVVKEYRDPLDRFASQVLNSANISWGQGKLEGVTTETYLSSQANSETVQAEGDQSKTGRRNFNASEEIERQLKHAFLNDPSLIINLLASQAGEFREEGNFDEMKIEHVKEFIDKRKSGKASTVAAA